MKYVLFETLSGIKKIIDPAIPLKTKKYGIINFPTSPELIPYKWYDLSFNLYKFESKPTIMNSSETNTRTIQKYADKKNSRKIQIFRILPLTPELYFENYKKKYFANINFITTPVLAYLQLFFNNALIFDNTKGLIAVFSALYRKADCKIFKMSIDHDVNVLKHFEEIQKDDLFIYGDNCEDKFDNVIIVGRWKYEEEIFETFEKFIENNILVHVPTREEAVNIARIMKNKGTYICINVIDFFFREWKIIDNMRPEMACDSENGYIVSAIKINEQTV